MQWRSLRSGEFYGLTSEVHKPGEMLRNEEVVARLAPVSLTDEELRQRQPSGEEVFAQRVGGRATIS